jgi:hypothetical protein
MPACVQHVASDVCTQATNSVHNAGAFAAVCGFGTKASFATKTSFAQRRHGCTITAQTIQAVLRGRQAQHKAAGHARHSCTSVPVSGCRKQVLDLLTSQSSSSGLPSAPDAEAVELLWEECGIPEGQHLTRTAWEKFMLQVSTLGHVYVSPCEQGSTILLSAGCVERHIAQQAECVMPCAVRWL